MDAAASNIKRVDNDRVLAFFSLELPSGAVLNSCILAYNRKSRSYSVFPPQIPAVDDCGAIKLSARNEPIFVAALSFRSARTRQHFEATALAALRTAAPDLFTRT